MNRETAVPQTGVGERSREGEALYREMKAAGVLPQMAMIFAHENEPRWARFRGGHAALTMAECLRDDEHRDVLLRIGNIFRFIQAVYVPADDFTDPATAHTFSRRCLSFALSRKRAGEGLFLAIDPLQTSSKRVTPGFVGGRHDTLAQAIRRTLAQHAESKDTIATLELEQLSPQDRKVVARARRLERFLTQPFFTTGSDDQRKNAVGVPTGADPAPLTCRGAATRPRCTQPNQGAFP